MSVETLTIVISAIGIVLTLGASLFAGFAWMVRRIDAVDTKLTTRINAVDETLTARIDAVDEKTDLNDRTYLVVKLKPEVVTYSFLAHRLIENGFDLTLFREDEINLETAFMHLTKGITS